MALEDWYFRISVLVFLYAVKKIWNVLYIFWVGPALNTLDVKSYGNWAMVTGSTDGIGKEYARQLAARGLDIILVSRSLEKLKNVASEIEKEFKVKTKIIQIDFTGDKTIYDKLAKEIQGLEIGTLVNNVGLAYEYLEYFLDLPDWDNLVTNLLKVNIESMVRVTKIVLPDMLKRNRGIVINIGSASGELPSPLLAVYAATKAFVTRFSKGLIYEYASKTIIIQNLSPHVISTNMSGVGANFLIPDAKTYVTSALSMLGSTNDSSGYFIHSCIWFTSSTLANISEKCSKYIETKLALSTKSIMLNNLNSKSK